MSQPIDVGSVLGGRYKVTSSIVESQEGDLVLDGIDQVLNRHVSILVAGDQNADQLAKSAREVATGERHGKVQVLDLGIGSGFTYLIANHSSAADLLDLIVPQEVPYVEPFFTDTLGSEIFGEARSRTPENQTTPQAEYIRYENPEPAPFDHETPHTVRRSTPLVPPPPAGPPRSAAAAASAGAAVGAAAVGAQPKVSLWPDETPAPSAASSAVNEPAASAPKNAAAAAVAGPTLAGPEHASTNADDLFDGENEDDSPERNRATPWLVGGVLAAVLVAALIFAVTTLGGVFRPQPLGENPPATSQAVEKPAPTPSADPTESESPTVTPEISDVTILNQDQLTQLPQLADKLPSTFDGNPATYWSQMEFADENWGGFVKSVSLAVALKEPTQVKQIDLDQLAATGGSVSVYTSDSPSLEGATLVGTNSFTGPRLSMPLPKAVEASYVIIDITTLPRLSTPQTRYDFGLRLAEIKIS